MTERDADRSTYSSPLRQRQTELTQTLIMKATAELIADGRMQTFTMHEVAERSGVSYASVYRHFPSRETLLEGLYNWGQDLVRSRVGDLPERLELVPEWMRKTFATFEEYQEAVLAFEVVQRTTKFDPPERRQRDEHIQRLIDEAAPFLSVRERRIAYAGIRCFVRAETWSSFRFRFGLDQEEAADAMELSLHILVADILKRNEEAARALDHAKEAT